MPKTPLTRLDLQQYNRVPILIVHKELSEEPCKKIAQVLTDIGVPFKTKVREKVSPKDFEKERIVIVVAGDGTTLRIAQHIRNNSLILPINSAPKTTEGALTSCTIDDFIGNYRKLIEGKALIEEAIRIEVLINNKLLPLRAINEISLSKEQPYFTFMYEMFNNQERATGILVCTPIGSTAWCATAGGEKLPRESTKLEYIIREPHQGKIYTPARRYGIIETIKIKVLTEGIIVFDSIPKEFKIRHNDMVEIRKSNDTIKFIRF